MGSSVESVLCHHGKYIYRSGGEIETCRRSFLWQEERFAGFRDEEGRHQPIPGLQERRRHGWVEMFCLLDCWVHIYVSRIPHHFGAETTRNPTIISYIYM